MAASSSSAAASIARISEELKKQSIEFTLLSHEAVANAEAHAKVAGHLPGSLAKNLFFKDKKGKRHTGNHRVHNGALTSSRIRRVPLCFQTSFSS
jgi:hypothetical protein